ncbi:hypothetical protein AAE478_009976 [Parahypoxylon ruwenzoriense]
MATESSRNGTHISGKTPLSSGQARTTHACAASEGKGVLRAERLEAFMSSAPIAILASDLNPQDIEAGHKARIEAELEDIMSRFY